MSRAKWAVSLLALVLGLGLASLMAACESTYEQFHGAELDRGLYSVSVEEGAPSGPPMAGLYPGATLYPGWQETKSLTIKNFGYLAGSYTIEATSSSPLVRIAEFPQTLSLEPGETYVLTLHVDVPLDQPDGPAGEVHVAVMSQDSPNTGDGWDGTVEIKKPTHAYSLEALHGLSICFDYCAGKNSLVSTELTSSADDVEAARAALAQSPVDRAAAVNGLHKAAVSLWQATDTLVKADAKAVTSTYAVVIQDLKNYSTLLLTVARNEAEQAIAEAEASGGDPALIAASRAYLADGDKALALGDHVKAATKYMNAANNAADSL